jgi:MFS family permease
MGYWQFLVRNRRLLCLGVLIAFAASFGQTHHIAIYSGEIRKAFDLSHAGFGGSYSVATMCSGFLLIWVGRHLDTVDLRIYLALICAGFVGACALMASTWSVYALTAAIFLLRLFGQGLFSHAASTTMARYVPAPDRGKAVSIAVLGFPMGEAVFPSLAVAMISWVGWRDAWWSAALFLAVFITPLMMILLRGHAERHAQMLKRVAEGSGLSPRDSPGQWTRAQVIRHPVFWVAEASMMGTSFIVTGITFHQVHLTDEKGWSLGWFAAAFAAYAGLKVLGSLATGPLVDRYGSRVLAGVYLLPQAVGLVCLAAIADPIAAIIFLGLAGLSGGVSQTLVGTLWAEMYGVLHLGSIKALVAGLSVIASAMSPFIMGWLIDRDVSMNVIIYWCAAYTVFSVVSLSWALLRPSAR